MILRPGREPRKIEITDELLEALEQRAFNEGMTVEVYLWCAIEAVEAYVMGIRNATRWTGREERFACLLRASNTIRSSLPSQASDWIKALEG